MNPGGFAPQATDIFTEGFSSPGIKLVDAGEIRQDVLDTILNMVRSPEMVTLDLRSMIACNNVARDRMQALIAKYGAETVDAACATLIEQSETAAARAPARTARRAVAIAPVSRRERRDRAVVPDHDQDRATGWCSTSPAPIRRAGIRSTARNGPPSAGCSRRCSRCSATTSPGTRA
jgi:hypothetical protein